MTDPIDAYLPTWDRRSAHTVHVAAAPERVFAAIRDHNIAASPLVKMLFLLRGLPIERVNIVRLLAAGFVLLEERPPASITLGLTGQFWKPKGGLVAIGPGDFGAFDRPDHCQAGWAFTIEAGPDGSTVRTETRIRCTDDAARRKFGRYWRIIGPFSGIVRRASLRTIKRLAEANSS